MQKDIVFAGLDLKVMAASKFLVAEACVKPGLKIGGGVGDGRGYELPAAVN
jgi:hypothetical protein